MKILHVIQTLGVGGAERLLVTLLPELKRLGDEVTVAVLGQPVELKKQLEANGVPVILMPKRHKWNLVAHVRNISKLANKNNFDIIHAHLYFPSLYVGMARIFNQVRASTCITFHNLAYEKGANKSGFKLWFRRVLVSFAYRYGIDRFIGVSTAVASHYSKTFNINDIHVLNNPVDLVAIDAALENAIQNNKDESFHIVVPGRLVHEKGHSVFISSLDTLRNSGVSFIATIAGDGPLRSDIEKHINKLMLSDCVTVTGLLPHDELIRVISSADVVVIPSLFEGFGLVAVEAMAVSRPLIATKVGGLPEVVVDNKYGILVQPNDVAALAEAVHRLMEDNEMRVRLSSSSRRYVEESFSLPVTANKLHSIYKNL